MLSSYFDKITISDINQDVLSGCECLVSSLFCLLSIRNFCIYCPVCAKFRITFPRIVPLNNSEFLASRLREGKVLRL
jgi:hypothetical protein